MQDSKCKLTSTNGFQNLIKQDKNTVLCNATLWQFPHYNNHMTLDSSDTSSKTIIHGIYDYIDKISHHIL
jgi:hypothetical protein